MVRRIIHIDKEKCNGCGICAAACHEGAIGMVKGKAELMRDDYCDGLGDCLPACPAGAIRFVEREAAAYDEEAVAQNRKRALEQGEKAVTGCPGSRTMQFVRNTVTEDKPVQSDLESRLRQWPVQIKLVPVNAPYFDHADVLVAADCSAYAYGNFHQRFLQGRIALVGCPKLDQVDYSEKLEEIIKSNSLKSITVVRMEVPCCGGLENAVLRALKASGKDVPCQVVTISTDGRILS